MKVLVYSDLQADDGSIRLRSDPLIPIQRWRVRRFYQWLARVAHLNSVDAVWDLGDTTNDRTALTHPTVQAVTTGCEVLMRGIPRALSFKLLGNHEQSTKATTVHCGDLFSPYFHVVQTRKVVEFGRFSFVLASYPSDPVDLSLWLKQVISRGLDRGKTVVVLGHFSVVGALMSSGVAQTGVHHSALEWAHLSLLGHIHRWQVIPGVPTAYYVGSPFAQDFGEAHDPTKVVGLLDLDLNTGQVSSLDWLHLPGFPAYRTVTVDELDYLGDDVVKVVIRNQREAQRFYAHPMAPTVEPVYAFTTEEATPSKGLAIAESREASVLLYVEQVPLPGAQLEELAAAGLALTK